MDRKKILVIDDEIDYAEGVAKVYLEKYGYEVRVESQGLKSLEAAQEFHPDLIFLDVMMRDCAGPKAASDIKSDSQFKDTPIVFVTATSGPTDPQGVYDGTISGYPFMAKPVKLEKLLECVRSNVR